MRTPTFTATCFLSLLSTNHTLHARTQVEGKANSETSVVLPASEAFLTGHGEAYANRDLARIDLGKRQCKLADLAGTWVLFYEVNVYVKGSSSRAGALNRIKFYSSLSRDLTDKGLLVVGVLPRSGYGMLKRCEYPEFPHPLWVTPKISNAGSTKGKDSFLDIGSPSELLLDPLGLVARGGKRSGIHLGHYPRVRDLVMQQPGLPLKLEKVGSKLRRSIAKRDWPNALSAKNEASRKCVERILEGQCRVAAGLLERCDVLSAGARIRAMQTVPVEQALHAKLAQLTGRLESPSAVRARKTLEAAGKLARQMEAKFGFRRPILAVPIYRSLDKKLRGLTNENLQGAPAVALAALRTRLDSHSPLTPCPRCKKPKHRCSCR